MFSAEESPGVRRIFEERAHRYELGNWQSRPLFDQEVRMIDLMPKSAAALDLGCGPGLPLRELARRARTVVGVDLSFEMLKLGSGPFAKVVGSITALPFRASSFDIAYARMSLHYVDVRASSYEIARVLADHGDFLVCSIVPYGELDAQWFNERHRIKGKGSTAYTPTIDEFKVSLAPLFDFVGQRAWTVKNSILPSARSNGISSRAALVQHALSAPSRIRTLYQIEQDTEGDVSMTVQWAVLHFRVRQVPRLDLMNSSALEVS